MADNTEILRRRTFAIIAHPDAGKTSLTEKLLLFGGQIQVAGAVKSNKIKKTATSDWMEIEKQRGISVTTSVMEFDYRDYKINILDTPGHQDFAEDTYRTLTAVHFAMTTFCWLPPDNAPASRSIEAVLTPSFLERASEKAVSFFALITLRLAKVSTLGSAIFLEMEKSRIRPSLLRFSVMKPMPALMASSGFLIHTFFPCR